MPDINELRAVCQDKSIAITRHARNRLVERGITIDDIQNAVRTGGILQQYEDDKPFPSCLLLGKTERGKDIHVVASAGDGYLYIITAYYPDESEWETNLKTRKERWP